MKDKIELKTLKEIDVPNTSWGLINRKKLKAEAIKWVKDLNDMKKHQGMKTKATWFIKHFFNITEEDLK